MFAFFSDFLLLDAAFRIITPYSLLQIHITGLISFTLLLANPIPKGLYIPNISYEDFVAIFWVHSDISVNGQYSNPAEVVELQPTVSNFENLPVISFLNHHIIDQLELELPKYLAAAKSISSAQNPHVW